MIETTDEDDVKLSPEDEERSEKWGLVFALQAGARALRQAAIRAHKQANKRDGLDLEEAFGRASRKDDQAAYLLEEAERLVRELNDAGEEASES